MTNASLFIVMIMFVLCVTVYVVWFCQPAYIQTNINKQTNKQTQASQPTDRPTDRPTDQPTNQPTNQPII